MPDRSIDTGREATTGRDTFTETTQVVRNATVSTQSSADGRSIIDRYLARSTDTAREVIGNTRDVTNRGISRVLDSTRSLFGDAFGGRKLDLTEETVADNAVNEPEEPNVIDTVRSYLDQLGERQRDYPIAVIEGSGGESSGISPTLLIVGSVIALIAFYFFSKKGA